MTDKSKQFIFAVSDGSRDVKDCVDLTLIRPNNKGGNAI